MPKQSQEDYLLTIYRLWEMDKKNIRSVDIAKLLNISKASVSEMLKKLIKLKLIKKVNYGNISFSPRGLNQAKKYIYKHRVIEVFLIDILKINKKNIHTEAHKLEHAFSDQVIKKLAKYLNNPKNCPDGSKIPKI